MTAVALDVPWGDAAAAVTVTGLTRQAWADLSSRSDGQELEAALWRSCVTSDDLPDADLADLYDDPAGQAVAEWCWRLSVPGDYGWAIARLKSSPRLAAEMEYCGARGIPHTQFAGWDDRSQDLALAWLHASKDVCPGCGVPADLMSDLSAREVVQRACVHCEQVQHAVEDVPEEHRARIHTYLAIPAEAGDD